MQDKIKNNIRVYSRSNENNHEYLYKFLNF